MPAEVLSFPVLVVTLEDVVTALPLVVARKHMA